MSLDPLNLPLMHAITSPPFSREGYIFEIKFDGYRALAFKNAEKLQLITRNKKDATDWFPELLPSLERIKGNWLFDAEVCVLDKEGTPDFERMRVVARPNRRQIEDVHLFVFDLLMLNDIDLRALPLIERKTKLKRLLKNPPHRLHFVDHIETKGEWLYNEVVNKNGLEGVMAKRANSPYVGARSHHWLKFKAPNIHDGWKRVKRK